MKFKNIEDVWAYAKNKLVNAQISSIQKTGSSKFFDLTVPKSMVKKFPEDCNRQDLNYTITQTGSNVDYFLENNGWEGSLVDTSDFFDAISGWCGINESEEETMNQNAIIGVESSHRSGFDKTITFSYYTSRADLEKQIKKIGKPYALDVLPSDEAEVHVKNADVDKFKGVISALHEKIDTSMNMCMMEGITIKGRPIPDRMKADFSSGEVSLINSTIGKTWYQITPKSKVWKDMENLMEKSKKSSSKMIDGCNYTIYEAPKGTTFMFMDLGMGAEAFLVGQSNINEAFALKGRPVPDKFKSDFDAAERKYIDGTIGTVWYQVTPRSKAYKDAVNLMNKSKKLESKRLGWFTYDLYEAPKGTKFLYAYDGYGSDAFMFGDSKINESEAQDKYREFFENKLKQWNVSSPSELTQEDRSKFFTEIREEWKKQKTNESLSIPLDDIMTYEFDFSVEDFINGNMVPLLTRARKSTFAKILKASINNSNAGILPEYIDGNEDNRNKSYDKVRSYIMNKGTLLCTAAGNGGSHVSLYYLEKDDFISIVYNDMGGSFLIVPKSGKINESFVEDGYEILTQDEFRQEFGGNGNLASYALYALYNTRLIVKCTPDNPNYSRIVAFVESLPDVTANDKQGIKCYRQTDSNLIIIYEGNVYWSYNTGTNLALLNEAELVKGLGKVFDTLSDTGTMSDNAVRAAIEALGGTLSELSLNPTTNSIKAYKICEDEYQCLIGELDKRGLRPVNR